MVNGNGPPLDGVNPIKARSPYDVPGRPGIPAVTEVGGDFVNLSWAKPENDGGSRDTGLRRVKLVLIFGRELTNSFMLPLKSIFPT